MAENKVKMDPLLSLAVMAAYSAEQECEFTGHNNNTTSHKGKAGWYMRTICPVCSLDSGVKPVCDKFRQAITSTGPLFVQCQCGAIDEQLRGCVVLCERIK